MNDINVIDGYHSMYPLTYKIKFRKIIENELSVKTYQRKITMINGGAEYTHLQRVSEHTYKF